jgi:hypothetical protein
VRVSDSDAPAKRLIEQAYTLDAQLGLSIWGAVCGDHHDCAPDHQGSSPSDPLQRAAHKRDHQSNLSPLAIANVLEE